MYHLYHVYKSYLLILIKCYSNVIQCKCYWCTLIHHQGLKQRKVKKEENPNWKGGHFANIVNKEHILYDLIENPYQKSRKTYFWSILCLIRTFQRASKRWKEGNQVWKRLKENEKRGIQPKGWAFQALIITGHLGLLIFSKSEMGFHASAV